MKNGHRHPSLPPAKHAMPPTSAGLIAPMNRLDPIVAALSRPRTPIGYASAINVWCTVLVADRDIPTPNRARNNVKALVISPVANTNTPNNSVEMKTIGGRRKRSAR